MERIVIRGLLLAQRRDPKTTRLTGHVLHIQRDHEPGGPAENAFVFVDATASGRRAQARYISWINLYDVDHAAKRQLGCWHIVEPHRAVRRRVTWMPFGWDNISLPSVADWPLKIFSNRNFRRCCVCSG